MEDVKKEQAQDWGYVEVKKNGTILNASLDFCHHFGFKQEDLAGESIVQIIQSPALKSSLDQQVIYGMIRRSHCLIKVRNETTHFIFCVALKREEVGDHEIMAFARSMHEQNTVVHHRYSFDDIIGYSPVHDEIKEIAAKVAISNSTILLTGETGTGKELFAQAIHGLSMRKNHPFVAFNCAAVPDELFESEVFGYEPGAFSGAKKEGKPGKLELAQNGTLFLDEISELSYRSQGKFLRVLQEREVERVGGTTTKNVDIRIIAATNKNLKKRVQDGTFRKDLFYRLYVFELKVPSLKLRKEDILPLAHYFIEQFNEQFRQSVKGVDAELEEWLKDYDWPGNIRELKAYIERLMNLAEGDRLTLNHLHYPTDSLAEDDLSPESPLLNLQEEVERAERSAVRRALHESNGSRSLAAQKLGIHIASLYRKMNKYELT